MRACSKCQLKTDESGRFCPECGGSLVLETQPRVRPRESPAASLLGATIDHQFALEAVLGSGS
ncbi:MAG TPA: hypothetical protein VLT45_27130, partial [Kofleriaceae bacterium]|nr:hypothetical protein [Kofleriaceae bacterium]